MAYPLSDDALEITSGFGEDAGRLAEEHVGVRVYKVGSRGQIGLQVHLATESWPDTRTEEVQEVRLEVLTTYERLGALGRDLKSLVAGRVDVADVRADPLA